MLTKKLHLFLRKIKVQGKNWFDLKMHLITYSYASASGTFPTKSRLQIKTFLYASPPFLQGSTKRSALWNKMMEKRIFGRRVEKRAIWTLIKDLFQVANLKWSSLVSNKLPSLFSGQIVGRHTTRGKDAIRGEKIQFFPDPLETL